MKTVILKGWEMPDEAAFHRLIAERMDFPAWYGSNLDALYDCLCEVGEPTQILLYCLGEMQENLGDYTQGILETFFDAQEENENLAVALMGDEEEE